MPFDIEGARSRLSGLERADAAELHEHISALAQPRLTGSDGAESVGRELRERFESLGYEARELEFSFSTFPGRFGLTVSGVLVAVGGAAATALLLTGQAVVALGVLAVTLAGALAPFLLLAQGLDRLPWGRVEAANLLFTRPGTRPSWVLMAHRDSKSQLVPSLVRTMALVVGILAWVALVVLAALWIGGDVLRLPGAVWVAGAVLVLAGVALALSWAGNDSPGALDNATGLAALLAVARRMDGRGDVAFLLTEGEEMGLAGARAVANRLPPVQGVINVDGLDDGGTIYVSEGHGWGRGGTAPQLAAALLSAGAALELPVERRRLPRSLMVDHLPIAAAGVPALTLLRGRWGSLMRVHRPSDRPDRIDGRGAAESATLLAGALALLREPGASDLASERATGS